MIASGEVSIARRLLAFSFDQFVPLIGMIPVAILGLLIVYPFADIDVSVPIRSLASPFSIAYYVVLFAYQYWSLLTGKPTIGQAIAKFYVDAKAQNFEPGSVQIWFSRIGVDLTSGRSSFWPATVHILLATLSMPIFPVVVILAIVEPENRFWWARIAGTATVDMRIAFRGPKFNA